MKTVHVSAAALWLFIFARVQPAPGVPCANDWTPRPGRTVDVRNVEGFEAAVRSARPDDSIVLADGDYALGAMVDVATPNVTIRGRSTDATRVVLRGRGMVGDPVGVALSISATGVTVANLSIRDVANHAIQVRGERGASGFTLHNARLQDTGQQLLKGSVSNARLYADNGLIECSEFSYTTSAPSDYTNGVDILATKGWVIRDNRFFRIRGPESQGWRAGPAILVWKAAEDTIVERNLIVDSYRGIALGLTPGPGDLTRNGPHDYDHLGGVIRNNVILNLNSWSDEAIEANAARDVRIEFNTVLVAARSSPWSIGVRFPMASALVRNNLTNQPLLRRNGGVAVAEGNVTGAAIDWFVDAPGADLHLSPAGRAAIDAGVAIPDVPDDFDRNGRTVGAGPDAGAFEWRGNRVAGR